jgi:hypothetical protein
VLQLKRPLNTADARSRKNMEPGRWEFVTIGGDNSVERLEIRVARSDWYEQVVESLNLGSYLIATLALPDPANVPLWSAALGHLASARQSLTVRDSPAVFGYCRAAIDALPGDKKAIFNTMPEGKKREEIDKLARAIGQYVHSGRHVVPNSGGNQAGEFPVNQQDAAFAMNLTTLLLSRIAELLLD